MYFLPANSCESLPMRFWDFMHDYFHSVRRDVQIHKDLSYILNYSFCFFLPETFPDVYMNNRHFFLSNLVYYYIFGKLNVTFA